MRPIVSPELTGAPPSAKATKHVSDQFVSLRGALAYTALTQAWIIVYIVSFQRVQEPTNLDVRRLNAVVRKLQKEPKHLIFPAMTPTNEVDLHSDSGYRRETGDKEDEVKGYGMRGLNLLRRGIDRNKKPRVHLLESICKSHRLKVRSSYGAETLAAAHGLDDAFSSLVTLHELTFGVLRPHQLMKVREEGGLKIRTTLTTDAESLYKSLSSRDLKTPTEKTLLGHVSWIREMMQNGIVDEIQWCDTRDMTADGHTKGSIDRKQLLEVMQGYQAFQHPVKKYKPHRAGNGSAKPSGNAGSLQESLPPRKYTTLQTYAEFLGLS